MLLIKGGKVFTSTGAFYDKADILIDDGKIVEVGENIKRDCEVIDVDGMWVLPGFIESHCHIGMEEPYTGSAGDDVNEATEPVTPYLNALDGVNLYDETFKTALMAGITTVCTGPGSANVIGGTFSILKTWGDNPFKMVVKEKAAMKAALGENPKRVYGSKNKMPSTRMGTAYLMREVLNKTIGYMNRKSRAENNNEGFELDMKYEELTPVVRGEMPLKIHVHRADDIMTALRIADEFKIKITLDHCSEGILMMNEIKKRNIPAIIGPTMTFRGKVETKGKTFRTPGIFSKEGITTAITTDHPVTCIEYLPLCAGLCVREGMDFEEAIRAITINPARILGIDERLGSIEEGKDADIVIFNGNPLEVMTRLKIAIVNGEIAYKE